MPRRNQKVYLEDIINACKELQQLKIDADNISHFLSKNYFYRTAERCFQIIGEALYHLHNLDKTILITEKAKIIRLRHMLTHDYDIIDYSRLWLYMEQYLPTLYEEVKQLLKESKEE